MSDRFLISNYDLKHPSVKISLWFGIFVLILLSVTFLFPVYWLIVGSFRNPAETPLTYVWLLPRSWSWANYSYVWNAFEIDKGIINSIILAAEVILVKGIFLSIASYVFSVIKPFGSRWMMTLILGTTMIPGMALMVPTYLVLQDIPLIHLSLLDSNAAIFVPGLADAGTILLLKVFFDGIDRNVFAAARIDGASEMAILTRIVVPLSVPILATILIMTFIGIWNDGIWPSIVISDPEKLPLLAMLYSLWSKGANAGNMQPIMVMACIPGLIVLAFFQKQIIRGFSFGAAVKG